MCQKCRRRLVEIDVRLGEMIVTMHSCSHCDTRWWDCDGRRLDLDAVISLAAAAES